MRKDVTLDTIGLYCPVPIMLASEKMKELEIGDVLEILADDPDSLVDIPNWCKRTDNRFLKILRGNGIYKFYVQKQK